jgi:hypothetical protein
MNLAPLSLSSRWMVGLGAMVILFVLVLSSRLAPAPQGHATHKQLGLPACGFVLATGKPCATCGMTTAFAHAATGSLTSSFRVQPVGAMLAILASALVWIMGYSAVTGSGLVRLIGQWLTGRALLIGGAIVLLGWAYKWVTFNG